MAEHVRDTKLDQDYEVEVSGTGLWIEITELRREGPDNLLVAGETMSIGRFAWPKVVEAVHKIMAARRVQAEVELTITSALGEDED